MNDRITTAATTTTHLAGWGAAGAGVLSFNELAIALGLLLSFLSLLLSWYYKRENHRAVVRLVDRTQAGSAKTVSDINEKANR